MMLAEALVAIVCHDLSSPVGTLVNALELAEEEPSATAEALLLARQAAARTVQCLELVRVVWAGNSAPLSRESVAKLAAGLPPKVELVMHALAGRSFDGPVARMLLHAVLVAATALPRGGSIVMVGDATTQITALPVGAHAAWPKRFVGRLSTPAPEPVGSPADALAPVLLILAREAGFRASLVTPADAGAAPACQALLLSRLT